MKNAEKLHCTRSLLQPAIISLVVLLAVAAPISAQQVTGTPGSPSATATIDGNQIPAPPKFGGVVKPSYLDSTPWWPPRIVPPKGAPNLLWIENASVEWNEKESPFHTVGRLTLLRKSQLAPKAADAEYIDVTGHATPDTAPVGSINRARCPAEFASRKARMHSDSECKR
jgi:hypothetical protein